MLNNHNGNGRQNHAFASEMDERRTSEVKKRVLSIIEELIESLYLWAFNMWGDRLKDVKKRTKRNNWSSQGKWKWGNYHTQPKKNGGNLLPLFRCVTRASCGRIVPSRSNHDARRIQVDALTRREVYDARCLSGQCPAQSPREKDDLVPRSEAVLEVQMRNKHQAAIAREQADDNIVRPKGTSE